MVVRAWFFSFIIDVVRVLNGVFDLDVGELSHVKRFDCLLGGIRRDGGGSGEGIRTEFSIGQWNSLARICFEAIWSLENENDERALGVLTCMTTLVRHHQSDSAYSPLENHSQKPV